MLNYYRVDESLWRDQQLAGVYRSILLDAAMKENTAVFYSTDSKIPQYDPSGKHCSMSQDKGRKYVTHTGRENVLAKVSTANLADGEKFWYSPKAHNCRRYMKRRAPGESSP